VPAVAAAPHAELQTAVLSWWERHGRQLNFRRTCDPYAVLVAEVIAQQTQIARVEPAWQAFLSRFPSVATLAAASPADVLRQWQGLGYNRRALNLHRAAQAVMERHAGVVPASVEALMALPGIGPYTARAVAAIAFGLPVGALDTNVRRVLGRAIRGEPEATAGPAMQALADAVVPVGRAGQWTHALRDVGALFCRPRNPRCDGCPLTGACRFRADPGVAGNAGLRLAPTAPRQRFEATTRWLRGRILDGARGAADDGWFDASGPIGGHDPRAVAAAVTAMAAEGLLQRAFDDPRHVRLPR
jgi:A/G-specific adenine glycosylase